ncbi:hypothetical protein [Photobacterium sanguinicancri]|uniref:hypothetical protein n=1 Tax=Photobacterium sanguinicancri TaxID=875932 RepID=UPI0024806EC1|nr:hypothetical protein [Photobacterium sanguinicancri]
MAINQKQKYKLEREDYIENLAFEKMSKLLKINKEFILPIQKDKTLRDALYTKTKITTKRTPDFAIVDGSEKYHNQVMFVEVNEPTGGLLTAYGIDKELEDAMRTAPLSNGMGGNVHTVLINKPNSGFDEKVISKLDKTYSRYSFNRSGKGTISVNTGLVFCMGDERHENITMPGDFHFNLSHGQFMPLVINTLYSLSGGKLHTRDALPNRNKVFSFEFCESYKHMGFVVFIGGDSAVNYNFVFVNDRFLRAKGNFVAKHMAALNKNKVELEC